MPPKYIEKILKKQGGKPTHYKRGGTVKRKTEVAVLHKGERILNPKQSRMFSNLTQSIKETGKKKRRRRRRKK